MRPSDDLFERVKNDDRYKRMLEATPEESREHVKQTVEAFLKELGDGLDGLKARLDDPETRKAYQEELKRLRVKGSVKGG